METLKDKLAADARFEANPPKPPVIRDATELFIALGKVWLSHEDGDRGSFEDMPRCTTYALADLLSDDDLNDDVQYRAMYRLASDAIFAMGKALAFAVNRLESGNEVDRASARGIANILTKAGLTLATAPEAGRPAAVASPNNPTQGRTET